MELDQSHTGLLSRSRMGESRSRSLMSSPRLSPFYKKVMESKYFSGEEGEAQRC